VTAAHGRAHRNVISLLLYLARENLAVMFAVFWLVEIFTDAEWPTNKQHRKPTSIAIHLSMELRLHGANLLFLCPQLQVNFIAWCQVVWMESTSKHAWNF
jgi:hypothetical protein